MNMMPLIRIRMKSLMILPECLELDTRMMPQDAHPE